MNKKGLLAVMVLFFIVFLPILLLLFSYKLVYGLTEYTNEQQEIINYLKGAEVKLMVSEEEGRHLEDVKGVIKGADYLFYISLLACVLSGGYFYRSKKKQEKQRLKTGMLYGGIATIILVAAFLIIGIINFEGLFTLFHKVFFPGGNWAFPAGSYLIETFPGSFFFSMAVKTGVLSLFLGILFIMGSIYLGKKWK